MEDEGTRLLMRGTESTDAACTSSAAISLLQIGVESGCRLWERSGSGEKGRRPGGGSFWGEKGGGKEDLASVTPQSAVGPR